MRTQTRTGTQLTVKRPDGVIETTVGGRVDVALVRAWTMDYRRLGGSPLWLFLAEETESYETGAVDVCSKAFSECAKQYGLFMIVAVLKSRTVRMGARLVAMLSRLDLRILANRADAEALIRSELRLTS